MDFKRFIQPVKDHKIIYTVSILILLGISIFSGSVFTICKIFCPESIAMEKILTIIGGFVALLIVYHILLVIDLFRRYR